MPTMRMPWSKSSNLQLDLLDASTVPEAAPSPPAAPGAARSASMVSTINLYEDANNPRTEIPEVDLDELADDSRQHGILQPIVVHPADAAGRHQIHFGAKRWRAAQRVGLLEVPVVVRDGPANPYAQVAENQKRQGLTPLDLARFIRRRIDAGDSNTTVAKALGLDLTTVAHHLALLDLPPVVDAAMKAGRCSSPRTLYELGKTTRSSNPSASPNLVASTEPITREAVAEIRDTAAQAPTAANADKPRTARPGPSSPAAVSRQRALREAGCHSDATGPRATSTTCPADDVASLRQRIAHLATSHRRSECRSS